MSEERLRFGNSNLGIRRMDSASALTLTGSVTLERSRDPSEFQAVTCAVKVFQHFTLWPYGTVSNVTLWYSNLISWYFLYIWVYRNKNGVLFGLLVWHVSSLLLQCDSLLTDICGIQYTHIVYDILWPHKTMLVEEKIALLWEVAIILISSLLCIIVWLPWPFKLYSWSYSCAIWTHRLSYVSSFNKKMEI